MHTHTMHVYILIDPEQKKKGSTMKYCSDLVLLLGVQVNKLYSKHFTAMVYIPLNVFFFFIDL